MVILNDTFAPGWRAYIDGVRAPVYEAYGMVRGVVVDQGEHVVQMRYSPEPLFYGAVLSFLGTAGLLAGSASSRWGASFLRTIAAWRRRTR
jgi:uncharacterized membrane protein YfhO